jgi:hypothetical protein
LLQDKLQKEKEQYEREQTQARYWQDQLSAERKKQSDMQSLFNKAEQESVRRV